MSAKNDRRSQRTRQLLGAALIELMLEKGYGSISVSDLIERANVGRSTFYAHYRDKDDLLVSELNRVVDLLNEHLTGDEPARSPFFSSLGFFRHLAEQYDLYKALFWSPGADLLFKHEQRYLSEKIEQRLAQSGQAFSVPLSVLANYLAGSFLTLLKWWLDNKMIYSPEQMDEFFQKLILPGVESSIVKT
jgi:AcrR family transcriptional regulator